MAKDVSRRILEKLAFAAVERRLKQKIFDGAYKDKLKDAERNFELALEDDFNTPKALALILNLMSVLQNIWKLGPESAKEIKNFMERHLNLLGFKFRIKPVKIPRSVKKLTAEREKFKQNQQFDPADDLRKKIEGLGYSVEDTPIGAYVKPLKIK